LNDEGRADRAAKLAVRFIASLTVVGLAIADFALDGKIADLTLLALLVVGGHFAGQTLEQILRGRR